MEQVLIATNNAHKAAEFAKLFAKFGIEVKTLADFPALEIEENGTTFEENARLKAQTAMEAFHLPVLADDSGLMVDALGGAPGVHSARYAGDHDDAANNAKLLAELQGVPTEQRTAHFHTTIVGIKPTGQEIIAHGQVDGHILTAPTGENGFGYDPLFYVDELGVPMATLTMEQKNAISHRGRALAALADDFKDWWN